MSRPWTVLLMAIAVAILFGTLSRDWASGAGLTASPAGFESCIADACHGVAEDGLPRDLVALHWVSMFAGFLSALAVAFCAHRLHHERAIPLVLATAVLCGTLIAMVAFELRALGALDGSIGTGFPIAMVGLAGAVVALFVAGRSHSAIE